MSVFEPQKHHVQEVLLYFFSVENSAVESHRLHVQVYGEAVLNNNMLWFRRYESGDVEDKERARRSKLVEDIELEVLLDKDPCQKNLQNLWEMLNQPFSCA